MQWHSTQWNIISKIQLKNYPMIIQTNKMPIRHTQTKKEGLKIDNEDNWHKNHPINKTDFIYLQVAFGKCYNSSSLPTFQPVLINRNLHLFLCKFTNIVFPNNWAGLSLFKDGTVLLIPKTKLVNDREFLNFYLLFVSERQTLTKCKYN